MVHKNIIAHYRYIASCIYKLISRCLLFNGGDFSQPRICRPPRTNQKKNPSKVVKFIEKMSMSNELKQMKNQFSFFELFSILYLKCIEKLINFEYKNDYIYKTKNRKNQKIDFSFVSIHSASVMSI